MASGNMEFDSEYEYSDTSSPGATGKAPKVVANLPHDEEVALASDGEDDGAGSPVESPQAPAKHGGDSPPAHISADERDSDEEDEDDDDAAAAPGPSDRATGGHDKPAAVGASEEGEKGGGIEGGAASAYNPEDYADLDVSDEIRELFQYIGRYKPHSTSIDSKLKPFIPDYIPAIGDIDEFIKVPRPDGKPDDLGLKVLDEPAAKQSDSTVLQLHLRHASKQSNMPKAKINSIEAADKNPAKIVNWIDNVKGLHKGQKAANVSYSKNMPDIETLMQEWDPEVEEVIKSIKLPDETIDMDLKQQAKLLCSILDIPTYNNLVESLHVMFTTYAEFKNNPFLQEGNGEGNGFGNGFGGSMTPNETMSFE